jgi:hypothetical protein
MADSPSTGKYLSHFMNFAAAWPQWPGAAAAVWGLFGAALGANMT